MSQKLAVDDNLKHPPSKSEDTVPRSGTSRESCKDDNLKHPLSKNEGMISENKDDKLNHPPSKIEELVPKNGTTLPKEESESEKDSGKNIHESEDSWYDLSQSFMTNLNDNQDCESPGPTHSEGVEQEKSKMSDTLHRDQLSVQQQHDEELQPLIAGALTEDESKDVPVCFYLKNNILMRKWRPPDALLDEEWRIYHQIVVPRTYRREILSIAHEMPFAGHLGVNKTYHRILNHFYWPKLKSDVAKFCKTCHSCQMVGKPNQNIPAAPLKPIPAFEEPFSRVIIDCVGPLPKSRAGHQYILTIMCASTRFPEAIPLRNIKARTVLQALLKFFTLFGLPKEIQSDQGSNFMSTVFQQMLYELGIDQIKSSAYHPESQGALERFHQTLKNMLKTYCHDNERDWDEGIPFVMFAARESIQESLGFSPFELVFGHTVRGPLKLLKEKWLSDPGEDIHLLDYVSRFKDRLHGACELAQENLRHSQKKMKAWYDKTTVKREFKPGDKVLVFLHVSGQPLQARFQGPYVIERKVSDTDYVILTPDKRKSKRVCHINMMKKYYEREDCDISKDESIHDVNSNTNDTGDQVCIINTDHELSNDEIKANNVPDMCIKLQNSDVLKNLDQKLSHLDHKEKSEMKSLIYEYVCLFSDDPTRTSLIEHDVDVGDATPIKQHPYRVNPRKRQHLRDEVRYMLDHDIIEPSNSEWSSPCILVPKPDGGYRFCTDYRKDTTDFIRKIGEIQNLPQDTILVTLDVSSLYTNIPNEEGISACKTAFRPIQGKTPTKKDLGELMRLILTNNNLVFGDQHYLQIHGTAMGTKMAPSFANLFMGNLEKEFLSRQILKPQIWLRFIDDIFMIWPHGEDSLKIFVENINSFHSTIKFTADSSRVSVHILDTTVTIENGSLKTDLFNKPTDKHNYLLPSSCHPPHCTKNIPYSQALRIKRVCSSETDFETRTNELSSHLQNRQYFRGSIENAVKKAKDTPRSETLTYKNRQPNSNRVPLVTEYHPGLPPFAKFIQKHLPILQSTARLKSIFPAPPVVAFSRPPNLRDILVRAKFQDKTSVEANNENFGCSPCPSNCKTCALIDSTKYFQSYQTARTFQIRQSINCLSKNVIYLIYCNLCGTQYVGESKNSLRMRMTQHRSAIKTKKLINLLPTISIYRIIR
ncbi:hypothetical protein HOLleu_20053 [Holothuria leucospilota]|uniref:Uncharacterized protein n=1 Tax=Holothuria leucospilota TaxID=206669 RepID=A0A9Q1H8E8_HOLLE|nr:hypothetical protein HOLleu_20053 [Holothuria leucospilota]